MINARGSHTLTHSHISLAHSHTHMPSPSLPLTPLPPFSSPFPHGFQVEDIGGLLKARKHLQAQIAEIRAALPSPLVYGTFDIVRWPFFKRGVAQLRAAPAHAARHAGFRAPAHRMLIAACNPNQSDPMLVPDPCLQVPAGPGGGGARRRHGGRRRAQHRDDGPHAPQLVQADLGSILTIVYGCS